jgi:hypothetical protein
VHYAERGCQARLLAAKCISDPLPDAAPFRALNVAKATVERAVVWRRADGTLRHRQSRTTARRHTL